MKNNRHHIEVAVALPVLGIYTYALPEDLVKLALPGKRVIVPFGPRTVTGYIIGHSAPPVGVDSKEIDDILDSEPLFPEEMLSLFEWAAKYYFFPIGEVIKTALPGGLNLADCTVFGISEKGKQTLTKEGLPPIEKSILQSLSTGECRQNTLFGKLNAKAPHGVLQRLMDRGFIYKKRKMKGGTTRPKTQRFVGALNKDLPSAALTKSRAALVETVRREGPISLKKLRRKIPSAGRMITALEKSGHLQCFSKTVYRDPFGVEVIPDKEHTHTPEQHRAITTIGAALGKGFGTWLLDGITGSGKTEVYLSLARLTLDKGLTVVVLVPEIALISQMEHQFRARFGKKVAVLHSGLSKGERYDQWMRLVRKEASISIGARSAVFAPLERVGLVIVDEEHDTSYKQDHGLRYHARDLAIVRAKLNGCVALLGSATPSLQTFYNARIGKFNYVALTQRINAAKLPQILVIDLKKAREFRGIRRFITPTLHNAMTLTLARGEQVLLFLNRRGFAGYPVCAACGEVVRCKNCDITLTLHHASRAYRCHYCGFSKAATATCLACGSTRIKPLGLGTEKVEEAVTALFPDAKVDRMDRDTTQRKGSLVKILKRLASGRTNILVGTQMVAKGHDFPGITLVGIICADISLNFPDFRAGEHTFQLLAQVAGRAGRGKAPGQVILQTFTPEHFSITAARKHDFKSFYAHEIGFRKALHYPPYSRLAQIRIEGRDPQKAEDHAKKLGSRCRNRVGGTPKYAAEIEILGPIEASIVRIKKRYRWQMVVKAKHVECLHQFLRELITANRNQFYKTGLKVIIDVDPINMS